MYRKYLWFIILLPAFTSVNAQVRIAGMVADSASLAPIANVNIISNNFKDRAVSNDKGYFLIAGNISDTLVFSIVGYKTQKIAISSFKETGIVYLSEDSRTLPSVVIQSNVVIPWLPAPPKESMFQNPTQSKAYRETPGTSNIQTFGPGIVLRGPISRFSKHEKRKKKLLQTKDENEKGKNYALLVNSPEVKDTVMQKYRLPENEFYRLLTKFNEKNYDIIYDLDSQAVIEMLLRFFQEETIKK